MLRVLLRVLLLELVVNNCQLQCLRRPRGSPLPLLVWMHRNRLPRLTTDTTEKLSLGYTAILRSVIFIHFRSISNPFRIPLFQVLRDLSLSDVLILPATPIAIA